MDAAQRIRAAVAQVDALRRAGLADDTLKSAVTAVKRFQARRFAGSYADVLQSTRDGPAAKFFLDELYGDKDFAERDAQFSRIAGAMQKVFPHQVVATAVGLAELHSLTEQLDHAMGLAWLSSVGPSPSESSRYLVAWRQVGRREAREAQLAIVMEIGHELARLTRTPGLWMMLKMMRGPAAAAGLMSLQRFLEAGFETFGALARRRGDVEVFLQTIQRREMALIGQLFEDDLVACETKLLRTLGGCPVSA